ncbi:MAG: DUF3467 domain-containing protein [Gammaproteobacteria bacterium]|uniref:DUF3467 domain-containing protein n=1 Tax=Pseudomaricurvus alcaniphilus TaxID=1166482 RepID=UPI00140A66B5|nr:DUF3467 domain-containing protein [Pseudomaricurvus alcaniphilus]MBR9911353.1 DUF3467 domain-containing protein [Gammaproteobacteria bacterium]NHN39530.1 DUF3467 domain-containing protein [Pseudomaricurvus alcaniphilus]
MDKPKEAPAAPKIKWDDTRMKSTYANVCNVSSTREEVTLLFGLNQAWNAQQRELVIELSDRMILNPYAAKRLNTLLTSVLSKYEERFGEIGEGSVEATAAQGSH